MYVWNDIKIQQLNFHDMPRMTLIYTPTIHEIISEMGLNNSRVILQNISEEAWT